MRDLNQELAEAEAAIEEAKRVKNELTKENAWRRKNHAVILQRAVDSLVERGDITKQDWGAAYEDAVDWLHRSQSFQQAAKQSPQTLDVAV